MADFSIFDHSFYFLGCSGFPLLISRSSGSVFKWLFFAFLVKLSISFSGNSQVSLFSLLASC